MRRRCDVCDRAYQAKRPHSRYCGDRCRKRARRMRARGEVVELQPAEADEPGEVEQATRRTLDEAEQLETPLAAMALTLARRMDSGQETGSGMASLAKQLQAMIDAAAEKSEGGRSPLDRARDELADRRAARGA